jgi:hypothetical protein
VSPSEFIAPGLPEPQGRGEDPIYFITRLYLLFLQGLFKQFPEGSYRWSDDEKLTEIAITDQAPFPRERIEQRPAIIAMRGPAQFANLSLDQLQTLDAQTGKRRHTDLLSLTMALNCVAKEGIEAQRIGWIVMSNIRRFKRLLQRNGLHSVGEQLSMGPESPPGSMITPEPDTEMVLVTVQSPVFFQWTEEIVDEDAVLLRGIEAHLQTAISYTENKIKSMLHPPTIRGRVIQPEPPARYFREGEIKQTVKT